jgi:hypothetical protein
MRTASKSLQIIALATCFAVHFTTNGHLGVSGVRRALQMISGASVQMLAADTAQAADAAPFAC